MRHATLTATCLLLLLVSCSRSSEPVSESRFAEPDKLYRTIEANVRDHQEFEVIVDIDHARLAEKAGSPMPPSHVLIWSDPKLEAAILEENPIAAVDLPLRVLSFEDSATGKAKVIANRFDFLLNRHGLPDNVAIREHYETAISIALQGIPAESIASFASDTMEDTGLVTLDSPHDFYATEAIIKDVINTQSDTVFFGMVDFAERAKAFDVSLVPLRLILFGAPGPGGKAMSDAPTLGLDAFCQKLLIWEDSNGTVHVTFNDLPALAERQKVSIGIPLRYINSRIKETFSKALEQ